MTIKFGAPYSSLLPPWKQALSPFDGGILDPHGADEFRQGSYIWNPASVRPDRGRHVITYEALIDACLLGPGGPPTNSVTDISQQLVGLWRILICRVAQGIGVTIKAPTLPGPLVLLSVAEARHGLPDLMSRASQGSIASIARRRDPDSMVAIVDWRMPHLLTHMILGNPIDLPNVTGRRIAYLDLMHELMPAPSSLDILGGRLIGQLGDAVQYWARGWGVEISPNSLPTSMVEPQLTRVRSALPKVINAARSRHEIGVLSNAIDRGMRLHFSDGVNS